jgi:hypothetical protein
MFFSFTILGHPGRAKERDPGVHFVIIALNREPRSLASRKAQFFRPNSDKLARILSSVGR